MSSPKLCDEPKGSDTTDEIRLCECGCEQPAPIAAYTSSRIRLDQRTAGRNNAGKHPPNYKGGRAKHVAGYATVLVDGKYELEHRLVMAEAIGRPLREDEVVHHVNGDRSDNRLENLMLFPNQSAHLRHHAELARASGTTWGRRASTITSDSRVSATR